MKPVDRGIIAKRTALSGHLRVCRFKSYAGLAHRESLTFGGLCRVDLRDAARRRTSPPLWLAKYAVSSGGRDVSKSVARSNK